MVGMVRDDDPDSGDFVADDLLISESLARKESEGGDRRNSRRTLEEILEERRLRRQLRDVFSDDDWDD
ncbi:PA3496 family putative envelope integrity protein [Endothiovibrio diazotrophicus]